jgi:hypothetical protein
MGLWVWVLTQTHTHKPAGSSFCSINKPTGSKVDPYPYPNRAKTYRVLSFGYQLPFLRRTQHGTQWSMGSNSTRAGPIIHQGPTPATVG